MAPVYKLKYFNYMGVAEPIRYLLSYGNIQWENIVVTEAEWVKLQKETPFGKLPILEVDNKVLYHSVAISKYLGKTFGLMPTDDWEVYELDSIAELVYGLGSQIIRWHEQTNQEVKNYFWQEFLEDIVPKYFNDLEEILKKKGTFFGGKKYTWVDFYVIGVMESIQMLLNKDYLPHYPQLNLLWNEIHKVPAIKNYISKRPNYKW